MQRSTAALTFAAGTLAGVAGSLLVQQLVRAGQQQAHGEQDNCHDDASPLSKTGVVVRRKKFRRTMVLTLVQLLPETGEPGPLLEVLVSVDGSSGVEAAACTDVASRAAVTALWQTVRVRDLVRLRVRPVPCLITGADIRSRACCGLAEIPLRC
eukprot:COSAG01_NODE_2065_length_8507_cov_67.737274_1_plen_154_part_00